ncbi:homoserine dehydrogenase [bacterium]|nr:homoserine dehydrogenase [bacterium]
MSERSVNVGVIGCGTVGTGVVRCLLEHAGHLRRHLGYKVELARIADIKPRLPKDIKLRKGVLTRDAADVINDPDIHIVVELVGGTTFAREIILEAMRAGKHVVTANKALLATNGLALHAAAQKNNVDLYYEASVAGGIPIIKSLREGLAANRIDSVCGIVNGTCNYILTRMSESGLEFAGALAEARKKGYAEADPSLDIDGYDARHKLGILASLAFGQWIPQEKIHVEGIAGVTALDIRFAAELGYVIKLLAIAKAEAGAIEVRVQPTLLPRQGMLANVGGAFNAIEVVGHPVGRTLFYGLGAGQNATSSAVVADIVDIARNIGHRAHKRLPPFTFTPHPMPLRPIGAIRSRYYLRCAVVDKPGVIAQIARALGRRNISISSVIQHESEKHRGPVVVTFMTHMATERDVQSAVATINTLGVVRGRTVFFRVETGRE